MRDLRLLGTGGAVIVANVALAAPVLIFIMRPFFKVRPRQLAAARID